MIEREHIIEGVNCWCGPRVEAYGGDMGESNNDGETQEPIAMYSSYLGEYGDRVPSSFDASTAGALLKDNELSAENVALFNQVLTSWARQFRDVAGAE